MQREIRMERLNTPTCGDWKAIVGEIIDYVRRLDRRFYSIRAIGTGSNYEGTSIKGSDFDLMLVIYDLSIESPSSCRFTSVVALVDPSSPINITVLGQGKYTMDAQAGRFVRVKVGNNVEWQELDRVDAHQGSPLVQEKVGNNLKGQELLFLGNSTNWQELGCVDAQGKLISSNVKALFERLVIDAVNDLGYRSAIDVTTKGPAVKLQIAINGGKVSVDLTLAIKCSAWPVEALEWMKSRNDWPDLQLKDEILKDGCYLVPVEPKGDSYFGSPNGSSWRFSFSGAEVKLFVYDGLGNANSCRNEVLRKVKTLKEERNWHPLKSYHLKTIMFFQCQAKPDPRNWNFDLLKDRLYDFLSTLEYLLLEGFCPMFFMTEINLFENAFSHQRRYELAEEVHHLRNSYELSPFYRRFLYFNPIIHKIVTERSRINYTDIHSNMTDTFHSGFRMNPIARV